MASRVATGDRWDDDEPDDDDDWRPDDDAEWAPDKDDDEPTETCPHCGQEIFDQTEQCPHCRQYISLEDVPPARKPWWIIVGALLCLFAVYLWIF